MNSCRIFAIPCAADSAEITSVYPKKTAAPKEEWQFRTDFSDLHEEFPELVDKTGKGWFYRHVHKVERFITKNSENMS